MVKVSEVNSFNITKLCKNVVLFTVFYCEKHPSFLIRELCNSK